MVNVRHLVRSGVIASGQETGMVPYHFCHWTQVETGTNCPKCNTYMPQASAGAPARRQSR